MSKPQPSGLTAGAVASLVQLFLIKYVRAELNKSTIKKSTNLLAAELFHGRAKRYSPRIWGALLASIGTWLMKGPEAEKILEAARKKDNKLTDSRKGWRVAA